jgi:glycosyltransferase involved in cell wall biosynthesis
MSEPRGREGRSSPDSSSRKLKLLIFVVAYNAERTVLSLLERIPKVLMEMCNTEALVVDDSSRDNTFILCEKGRDEGKIPFPLHVLFNPDRQGYGGSQKIGYQFAISKGFDIVALVHGDGQYAPEELPGLIQPIRDGLADAVFGLRMMEHVRALKGGVPFYQYAGNKILTWIENRLLHAGLSAFHAGCRVYSVEALKRIPFHLNTNDFHFDTEIIIQLIRSGMRIVELPITTYYEDEMCHVNGIKYVAGVIWSMVKVRLNDINLLYDRKFDCRPVDASHARYQLKTAFTSTHSLTADAVPYGSSVVDLGCAGGHFGRFLREKRKARVVGVDVQPLAPGVILDEFISHDLDANELPVALDNVDVIVILDVIEHLKSPEKFVELLREKTKLNPRIRLIVTTGNIAFILLRLLHLAGIFNYGKKGILDLTHLRLFTFSTLAKLFEQQGFRVLSKRGVPAPWPFVFGDGTLSHLLMRGHLILCQLWPSMFAYQIFMEIQPRPHPAYLLAAAYTNSIQKSTRASG